MTSASPARTLIEWPAPQDAPGPQLTDRASFDAIAERSRLLRQVLADRGIRFHRDSALGVLLRDAERYAKDRAEGKPDMVMRQFVNTAHAYRIAEAVLGAQFDPDVEQCLRRIAGNDVNLSGRTPSMGKDHLWELELLAFLRQRQMTTRLQDPPDLMIELGGADYPIACKKIYSDKGAPAQMRKGVRQLGKLELGGIVAFNIDDLTMGDAILQSRTRQSASDNLARLNKEFLTRHERVFAKYVSEGRCDGVLVSASVMADIETERPRFLNFTEVALWSLDGAPAAATARIERLKSMLARAPQPRLSAPGG